MFEEDACCRKSQAADLSPSEAADQRQRPTSCPGLTQAPWLASWLAHWLFSGWQDRWWLAYHVLACKFPDSKFPDSKFFCCRQRFTAISSRSWPKLPIDELLPQVLQALSAEGCVVLQAAPGAGKTTRVPPAILDAGLAVDKQVVMLEPRRLAARSAAARIAAERGTTLGTEIGYQVRFDRKSSPQTKLLIVTEGILVRMLQDDPFLDAVGVVVFDEFHERNLDADLALAMTRRVRQDVRDDLKLVIMSATVETEPLAAYLGNCPVVTSPGRAFPVDLLDRPPAARESIPHQVAAGVELLLQQTPGDVLAFLPGVGEIRQTQRLLESRELTQAGQPPQKTAVTILPLYGDLPPEEQDAALRAGQGRKIVLATNVAETSVTVEGVTGVVDSGWARVLQFDPQRGINRLELSRIPISSADQRAGRAGRTAPGICLRLWHSREDRSRPKQLEPEIQRVDLAGTLLELACWGESDPQAFHWLTPPRPAAINQATELLLRLGALEGGSPTELGRQLVQLPVHPRLGRLLIEGHRLGYPQSLALVAALLSERNPFSQRRIDHAPDSRLRETVYHSQSDVWDRFQALQEFDEHGRREFPVGTVQPQAARFVLRAGNQLRRLVQRTCGPPPEPRFSEEEAMLRSLLVALPDRIARRRSGSDQDSRSDQGSRRAVLVDGRGVRLAAESAVEDAELFVCVEIEGPKMGSSGESLVRMASAIERDWLPPDQIISEIEVIFDSSHQKVCALRRIRLARLILEEHPAELPDGEQATEVLAQAAGENLSQALALGEPSVAEFLARVGFLRQHRPELGLPVLDDDVFIRLLPLLCQGRRSFAELQKAPLLDYLKAELSPEQLQTLEREAPWRLAIPSGRQVALQYQPDRPPVLAAKIQELFGMHETPRIAGGRVRVVVHLLAPNGRPEQVTQDLRSFWETTYHQVRKDLRRRYSKHAWPEDPLRASPEQRGRRNS